MHVLDHSGRESDVNASQNGGNVGNFRTSVVSRKVLRDPSGTDAVLLRLIGRNKRVLELGCGAGHMSEAMRDQECDVVGMEINNEARELASAFCEKVITADLDYVDFDRELDADRF